MAPWRLPLTDLETQDPEISLGEVLVLLIVKTELEAAPSTRRGFRDLF